MRCDNCGWNNPEGLTKCQKCNQELNAAPVLNQTIMDPSKSHSATVAEEVPSVSCVKCGYPLSSANTFCPNCGFQVVPVEDESSVSRNAKTVRVLPDEFLTDSPNEVLKATVREIPIDLMEGTPERRQVDNTKTVRVLPDEFLQEDPIPVAEQEPAAPVVPGFRLVPMDNFDGKTPQILTFNGDSVSVERKDIVEADASIDENLQVSFEYSNGQWSVSQNSGTMVFVSASHKLWLQPGDVVVIGNRRFIFE